MRSALLPRYPELNFRLDGLTGLHSLPGIINTTVPRGVAPNVGPGLAATLGKPGGTEEDICFYGTMPVRPLPCLLVTSSGPPHDRLVSCSKQILSKPVPCKAGACKATYSI